jgi:hypothetical protein
VKKARLRKIKSFSGKALSISELFIERVPVILPAFIAGFGFVVMALLVSGNLRNVYILLFSPVLIILLYFMLKKIQIPDRPGTRKEQKFFDTLTIFAIIIWCCAGIVYSAQNIFVYRDPGIYSVTGAILVDNENLDFEKTTFFGNDKRLKTTSAGFGQDTKDANKIFAQGQHLFPALIGLVGRLFGERLMLATNVVFGGAALLAVYGFSRLLARPRWAFLSTIVLSITLPMLYFSRDSYTEPLAVMFTFGALSWVWAAQHLGNKFFWSVSGLTAGSVALTRPDGFLIFIALLVFLGVRTATDNKFSHKVLVKQAAAFILGATPVLLIAWLDITVLSSGHYASIGTQVRQQIMLAGVCFTLGCMLVLLSWRTSLLSNISRKFPRNTLAIVSSSIIFIGALLLASRPLWLVSRKGSSSQFVIGLQQAAGQQADGYRTYAEQTVSWLIWYMGPVIVLLGLGGLILAVYRMINKDKIIYLPMIFVVGLSAVVFLNQTKIAPDQIWATRRLLPVVIPGIVVFSVLSLEWVSCYVAGWTKVYKRLLAITCVVLLVAPPLYITRPFIRTRTYSGQVQQVIDVCRLTPSGSGVLWVGKGYRSSIKTIEAFCDVPAVGLAELESDALEAIATESRGKVIVVTTDERVAHSHSNADFSVLNVNSFSTVSIELEHPPRGVDQKTRTIFVGTLQEGGGVTPLDG